MFVENIYNSEEEKNKCIPGTRYKSVSMVGRKKHSFDAELVSYNFPYSTSVKGYTKEGVSFSKYALSETYEGTLATLEVTIKPKNYYYKVMIKLLGWMSKMLLDEQLDNLKAKLEEN
jgi:Iap family predicted aminopeptidase